MSHSFRLVRTLFVSLLVFGVIGCGGTGGVESTGEPPVQLGSSSGSSLAISGQPKSTVVAGRTYTFQATVTGGSAVSFSASNLPSWLTLNSTTGKLSGTPQMSDVGNYSGITVSASDGSATKSLGPFTISVVAVGSGRATLSWTPPTLNTDGSALTDLSGYVISFGESSDDLSETVTIDNPSVSTQVVDNLTSGTWYFTIQSVSAKGTVGPNAPTVSKSIS